MPKFRVRLCGEPAILRDAEPIDMPASRKTRALLFLLLRSGRAWRREQLCEMLWDVPDDPRGALRWSLSKIRRALGEQAHWLVTERERVACVALDASIDLDEMSAMAQAEHADPQALLSLADAALEPPLLGLDLSRCPSFDNWLESERLAANRIRIALLTRAADLPQATPECALRYRHSAELVGAHVPVMATPLSAAPAAARHGQDQQVRYRTMPGDVRIAYACTGSGPPLVKAANWLNHLELDWESPLWGLLIHELSERHQLIRYDERGNGLSQWDVDDISFEAFVRDLEGVVDGLGLERFPLIGISQGCAVSIEYAARHPERVSRLVLIGGYATGWRVSGDAQTCAEREATMTLVGHGWGKHSPAYRQIFSHSFFPGGSNEELDWFNEFQRQTTSAANAVRFLQAFSTIDVRRRLPEVSARTLVIHARGDQRVALEQGVAIASGIPDATLVTLDSDSHLPLDREPAHARMLQCIHEFLAGD